MSSTTRRRRLVLIVDDNPELRAVVAGALEGDGFEAATARNGTEAVSLTRALDPDVVLMDLAMPEMDGIEATRTIRAEPRTAALPVIVLTASASDAIRRRAYAAGCTAFLVKPVEPEELIAVIEEVIDARGRAAREQ